MAHTGTTQLVAAMTARAVTEGTPFPSGSHARGERRLRQYHEYGQPAIRRQRQPAERRISGPHPSCITEGHNTAWYRRTAGAEAGLQARVFNDPTTLGRRLSGDGRVCRVAHSSVADRRSTSHPCRPDLLLQIVMPNGPIRRFSLQTISRNHTGRSGAGRLGVDGRRRPLGATAIGRGTKTVSSPAIEPATGPTGAVEGGTA